MDVHKIICRSGFVNLITTDLYRANKKRPAADYYYSREVALKKTNRIILIFDLIARQKIVFTTANFTYLQLATYTFLSFQAIIYLLATIKMLGTILALLLSLTSVLVNVSLS